MSISEKDIVRRGWIRKQMLDEFNLWAHPSPEDAYQAYARAEGIDPQRVRDLHWPLVAIEVRQFNEWTYDDWARPWSNEDLQTYLAA